ncbi:hypothetical protein AVEN_132821-1 [Araneus ventricosus]|uniref:Uncharacterized protein n=1 Tax=Araneus ventricosus TaxID=182803 RepID=A0A4Y2L1H8_ARAVE|nr:hypothetical protein AVEN_132821-1 [Araneus ventricosus]
MRARLRKEGETYLRGECKSSEEFLLIPHWVLGLEENVEAEAVVWCTKPKSARTTPNKKRRQQQRFYQRTYRNPLLTLRFSRITPPTINSTLVSSTLHILPK